VNHPRGSGRSMWTLSTLPITSRVLLCVDFSMDTWHELNVVSTRVKDMSKRILHSLVMASFQLSYHIWDGFEDKIGHIW
jgi:hypothetical protein